MKLSLCLVFVGLIALALSKQVKYDNYKVFRITPQTEEERKVLLDLEENNPGVVFWKHVRQVGLPVDIMVQMTYYHFSLALLEQHLISGSKYT